MPSYTGISRKQQEPGRLDECLTYIWNPKEGKVCNRKFGDWALLLIFYVTFLTCVVGSLFILTLIMVTIVSSYSSPWIQAPNSGIGPNPGLGFRPVLHLSSPIIWYKWEEGEMSYREYVKKIETFFRVYREHARSEYSDCKGEILPMKRSKPCFVDVTDLGNCSHPTYGYDESAPCVYIKINKIHGWSPKCYNKTSDLPGSMPDYLRKHIETLEGDKKQMNTVWLSCEGYYPADTQHMGEISMFPRYGFQASHFPYTGQKAFVSPIVAIKFKDLLLDTLITVHCRAWAHNIVKGATVEFQLMVGSKEKHYVMS